MQLAIGSTLQEGKYKIEKVLGQGTFGITYKCYHTRLQKQVAIKEFFMRELNSRSSDSQVTGLTEASLSFNYGQKFKKEAINLSKLDHRNIVRVIDSFDENGTFYYVMDFLEGENLNEYIKNHKITQDEAVSIMLDVANALKYMHEEKRMLHLDLKPGNIMRRNSDGHIFLIDFGLSKHFDASGEPESSTSIGLGTAGYAPIEQMNSAKKGEFRPGIDIYALGATFYKLLTGETPADASTYLEDEELLNESLTKHTVSEEIKRIVTKAMKPVYKNRTQSVDEFIQELKDIHFSEQQNSNENKPSEIQDNEETRIRNKKEESPIINEETLVKNTNNQQSGTAIEATVAKNSKANNDSGAKKEHKENNSPSVEQKIKKSKIKKWLIACGVFIAFMIFISLLPDSNNDDEGQVPENVENIEAEVTEKTVHEGSSNKSKTQDKYRFVVIENGVLQKVPTDFSGKFVVENGITEIGNSAFSDCSKITGVSIPNSVKTIGEQAFRNCTSLSNIVIPRNVTSIGSFAFDGCSNMVSITFKGNVSRIGNYVFDRCSNLQFIYIQTTSKEHYESVLNAKYMDMLLPE